MSAPLPWRPSAHAATSAPAPQSGHELRGAVTRRQFVGGALTGLGLAGWLTACGSGEESTDSTRSATAQPPSGPTDSEPAGDVAGAAPADGRYTVVQRFPQQLAVPGLVRLPISLSTGTAELVQDGPAELSARVVDLDGNPLGDAITAIRRDTLPAPYWAFTPTIEAPGIYALVVAGGPPEGAAFQVFDRREVAVPSPGDPLEPLDTPTVTDARGVDPICTRQPEPCPFHDVTLTEALEAGKNVAYYIGTPAYCSTGSCAPGLESLIELSGEFADSFTFVHAEVYTDTSATEPTPAVESAGMFYEPAIFLTDPDGVVVDRLDSTWDTTELREAMARVAG